MAKRLILLFIAITATFLLLTSPVFAAETYSYFKQISLITGNPSADVNGNFVHMEQAPYEKNGRTMVPFRLLGESLGAEISWDNQTNKATLKLGSTEVIIIIGSKLAYVNGKLTTLDVPAEVKYGRTFIPLRFVSESLGAWVSYADDTKLVSVSYVDKTDWIEYTSEYYGIKLKHPSDWKISEDNTFITITSPNESVFCLYFINKEPEEVMKMLKKNAESNGWILDEERLYNPDNPNGGGEMFFYNAESLTGTPKHMDYYTYINTLGIDKGSRVAEMVFDYDFTPIDSIIMLEILNS